MSGDFIAPIQVVNLFVVDSDFHIEDSPSDNMDLKVDVSYQDVHLWKNDNGANPLRALFYSIPAILSLIGKRCIDQENSAVVNLCVNCCACTAILYLVSVFSSGIYIGRLPVYTTLQGYAVMPWLINHMFTKQSAKIIAGGLVLGFVAFFYYQMHIAWNAL